MLYLLLVLCLQVQAQNNAGYRVGFAKASIDPPDNILGLSLAGYGLPADGRFSTMWESTDSLHRFKVISSYNGKLLGLNAENKWLLAEENGAGLVWKESSFSAKGKKAVAVLGKEEYILDENGKLWQGKHQKHAKKLKSPVLQTLTSDGQHLYAVDDAGHILRGNRGKNEIVWTTIGKENSIEAMTVYGEDIIFSDDSDRLWKIQLKQDGSLGKRQIGQRNDVTYTVKIKQLAATHERVYALDANGHLFVGKHKIEDNLEAGAVVIQYKDKRVIIVTLDVCGVDHSFTQKIKKSIALKHGLQEDCILINASHTHFAPVTQAWTTWAHFYHEPDSTYLNKVVGKNIIVAVGEANFAMQTASLSFWRWGTHIGLTRRGNFSNRGAPVDRTLDVVKVLNQSQALMGLLFFAGCHPVFPNAGEESFTVSANFPGVAREVLASHTGSAYNLFVQGCGGDINPVSQDYRETGTALAQNVMEVLATDMSEVTGELTAFVDSVLIPIKPMTLEQIAAFREKTVAQRSTVYTDKDLRWADLIEQRYRTNSVQQQLPVYVQTLNIGSWKLIGLSREAVTSYGMKIRKLWPDNRVSVAAYCNDVASYLPDSWHIEKGVYEGYDSFFWYGQDGIPPLDTQEIIINQIKIRNR